IDTPAVSRRRLAVALCDSILRALELFLLLGEARLFLRAPRLLGRNFLGRGGWQLRLCARHGNQCSKQHRGDAFHLLLQERVTSETAQRACPALSAPPGTPIATQEASTIRRPEMKGIVFWALGVQVLVVFALSSL